MEKLPDEMLIQIFQKLQAQDLINMKAISQRFGAIARHPKLWQNYAIAYGIFSTTDRNKNIGSIPFPVDTQEGYVPWLVTRVEWVRLGQMTEAEIAEIMANIIEEREEEEEGAKLRRRIMNKKEGTKEKIVNLENLIMMKIDLKKVEGQILAKGITKITYVSLERSKLTTEQLNILMKEIVEGECLILDDLRMGGVNLKDVNTEAIAKAFTKLRRIDITDTEMNKNQMIEWSKEVVSADTLTLEEVRMTRVNLSGVEPQMLAAAILRMKRMDADSTDMTTIQVDTLTDMFWRKENQRLTNFGMKGINLRQVNTGMLAQMIHKLEVIDIRRTNMEQGQQTIIFERIIKEDKLPTIIMDMIGFPGVENRYVNKLMATLKIDQWWVQIHRAPVTM